MELLMINYLARGHGVIIHACGIDNNGIGMLFAGESGAGKSTLANLWNQEAGVAVLSDDRTLVRQIDGEWWLFGTPWHGEAKFGSRRGIKLEKSFSCATAKRMRFNRYPVPRLCCDFCNLPSHPSGMRRVWNLPWRSLRRWPPA